MQVPFTRRRPSARGGNPNRVPEASLQAAGYRVTRRTADATQRVAQEWQSRAFGYYNELGEINYAAQFYARMLSPLRLYPAKKNAEGEWEEILPGTASGDDLTAVEALDRVQDPGGGRENLLGQYGRLMFIAGEGILFCSQNRDTELEQWEMLSTNELRIQSGTYSRIKAPSLNAEEFREPADDDWEQVTDETAVAYRLWRRHPEYSMLADSTMRGVLELCEELLLLSRAVRSRTRSRLATAGILAVAEEFSYKPLEPEPDEDPEVDPFLADLTAAIMTAITNEGAASAAVPLILRGPVELIDKGIRHVQITDPTQLYPETGLRFELLKRIAVSLDMPPEVLLGIGDTNHWNAWQIDEQTWKLHGMPVANQLVGDLNGAYFLPQLRADGVKGWQDYAIRYDAADVINHPDRTRDAKDLYGLGELSGRALRDSAGFDEDDEPTPEERNRFVGIKVHDASLAVYGIPGVGRGGIEPEPGVITDAADSATAPSPGATGTDVQKAAPEQAESLSSNGNGHGDVARAIQLARMLGAVDLALLRAREVAGNRLRSLAKRNDEALELIEGVAARDVAATLGPIRARALGAEDAEALVAPASSLLRDSLRIWEIDAAAVDAVVEQVEKYAAKTLYDLKPAPLSPQFEAYLDGTVGAIR